MCPVHCVHEKLPLNWGISACKIRQTRMRCAHFCQYINRFLYEYQSQAYGLMLDLRVSDPSKKKPSFSSYATKLFAVIEISVLLLHILVACQNGSANRCSCFRKTIWCLTRQEQKCTVPLVTELAQLEMSTFMAVPLPT